jgi:hypothetical protein
MIHTLVRKTLAKDGPTLNKTYDKLTYLKSELNLGETFSV